MSCEHRNKEFTHFCFTCNKRFCSVCADDHNDPKLALSGHRAKVFENSLEEAKKNVTAFKDLNRKVMNESQERKTKIKLLWEKTDSKAVFKKIFEELKNIKKFLKQNLFKIASAQEIEVSLEEYLMEALKNDRRRKEIDESCTLTVESFDMDAKLNENFGLYEGLDAKKTELGALCADKKLDKAIKEAENTLKSKEAARTSILSELAGSIAKFRQALEGIVKAKIPQDAKSPKDIAKAKQPSPVENKQPVKSEPEDVKNSEKDSDNDSDSGRKEKVKPIIPEKKPFSLQDAPEIVSTIVPPSPKIEEVKAKHDNESAPSEEPGKKTIAKIEPEIKSVVNIEEQKGMEKYFYHIDTINPRVFTFDFTTGTVSKSPVSHSFPSKCEYIQRGFEVFVCGGQDTDNNIYETSTISINMDETPLSPTILGNMIKGRVGHSLAIVGRATYCVGGYTGVFLPDVEYFMDGKWILAPVLKTAVDSVGLAYQDLWGKIYAFGGRKKNAKVYDQIQSLEIEDNLPKGGKASWEEMDVYIEMGATPSPVVAIPFEGQILLLGTCFKGKCFTFNPNHEEEDIKEAPMALPDEPRFGRNCVTILQGIPLLISNPDKNLYMLHKGAWSMKKEAEWLGEELQKGTENTVRTGTK